jgi:hypothetical protein
MKQKRPFSVIVTEQDKANMRANAARFGHPYGVFFDTSGKARIERVNPSSHYGYLWRTDDQPEQPQHDYAAERETPPDAGVTTQGDLQ